MDTILIVEDEIAIAEMYKIAFTRQRYLVALASDGEEGLRKAKLVKPAMILLDIMMPKMNGMQMLEKLKSNPELANIPIIMLSNISDISEKNHAIQYEEVEYITKSAYTPSQIVELVRRTLQKIT